MMVQSRGYKYLNPGTNPVRRTDEKNTQGTNWVNVGLPEQKHLAATNEQKQNKNNIAAGQQRADPHHGLQKKGITCEY
jgi:hypothetical protein